ncbi:hypothetical protein D3C79_980970 [compost metagenome]
MIHGMKVGDRQKVSGAEGLTNIALSLDLAHAQCVAANIVRALNQGCGRSV